MKKYIPVIIASLIVLAIGVSSAQALISNPVAITSGSLSAGGALLSVNNLSDVASTSAAINNLTKSVGIMVGIGTPTPTSSLSIGGSGQIDVPLGAAGTPSYSFSGDLDSGMFASAANTLGFSVGGIRSVFISSSGIGSNNASGGMLSSAATSATVPAFAPNRTDMTSGLGASATGSLALITSGTTKVQVLSNGNVGVGTSTPAVPLQVWQTASSTVRIGALGSIGCLELGGAGTNQIEYVYVSSSVLVATSTKPTFCQ